MLKEWESQDLLERIHPLLSKKHPSYDSINRLIKVRDDCSWRDTVRACPVQ